MEQKEVFFAMLDQLDRPAFFVKDGRILRVNAAAEALLVDPDTPIKPLLATGLQEYPAFQGGCLHLRLRIAGGTHGATVTRVGDRDMFALDAAEDGAELQAMALAAQELRQPLASVMTVADRLFPVAGTDPDPALQDQIARINRGLFQMLRIIGNMSDAYRYSIDASTSMQTQDAAALIEELFAASAALVEHAGVQLEYSGPRESIYWEKLERAISNIISNAVKFSPKGSRVTAKLTRRGNMLYLTVQDGGEGVAENLRGRVYDRFQRSPGIEDGRYGIGLGMVLIRAAAAIHGGTVLMEQSDGNRITLTIAIRQSKETFVRTNRMLVDYAGEWDHKLIELSDVLPAEVYRRD